MKSIFKVLPLAVVVAAAGCASNSQIEANTAATERAQSTADQANDSAARALSAANAAQSTADKALRAAQAAQAAADQANEKVDRAFKKSMQK